ncbi:MAG: MFS transporter, partial [Actinomycetota bacterium]|nr:MFS transporter [Actinomycetota bacterium]
SQAVLLFVAATLAVTTGLGLFSLPLTYGMVVATAVAASFEAPARSALATAIVPAADVPSAIALGTIARLVGFTVGPGIAGVLLGSFSPAVPFAGAVSLLVAAIVLTARVPSVATNAASAARGVALLKEGLSYVRHDPVVFALIVTAVAPNTVGTLGALLPIFARDVLAVSGPQLGLLFAASSVGALAAGLGFALFGAAPASVRVALLATAVGGLAVLGFGMSRTFELSLIFLVTVGVANVVAEVTRSTLILLRTPDGLRGRMTSVLQIVLVGGPALGFFEQGLLVTLLGPPATALIGGGLVVAATGVASRLPGARRRGEPAQLAR